MPASLPIVVFKVGGSLLDLPDLPDRLAALIPPRRDIRPLLIVGGGLAADAVRAWGKSHSLSDGVCHELAIQSMSLTAALLTRIVPRSRLVRGRSEAEACWTAGLWPVLNVEGWLASDEAARNDLPKSWAVTSDSLAARAALAWNARELWLVKSIDLPPDVSYTEGSRRGYVDEYFPQLAAGTPSIVWCNLRADDDARCGRRWTSL